MDSHGKTFNQSMGKKHSVGQGGSSHKRGRGKGRGISRKGRFNDLSAPVSSPSFQDRPESAVDDVDVAGDEIDSSSSDSGMPPVLANLCLSDMRTDRQGFTDSNRGPSSDVGKCIFVLHSLYPRINFGVGLQSL